MIHSYTLVAFKATMSEPLHSKTEKELKEMRRFAEAMRHYGPFVSTANSAIEAIRTEVENRGTHMVTRTSKSDKVKTGFGVVFFGALIGSLFDSPSHHAYSYYGAAIGLILAIPMVVRMINKERRYGW